MAKVHMNTSLRDVKQALRVRNLLGLLKNGAGFLVSLGCAALVVGLLGSFLLAGTTKTAAAENTPDEVLMDSYDMYMTNHISDALDGVLDVEKVYWLDDEDTVAPEPDQAKFGSTTDPGSLQWLLDEAAELLDGQELLFSTETEIIPGTEVHYYLDETIFSIAWKQEIEKACYNFNEVKIAHASQFRRFLADGQYGSERQYYTTQMSAAVNAVCATNGDFYKYRPYGIVVYNGEVYRSENTPDTCFIDDQGDMILVQDRTFKSKEEIQQFVDENNIRFSLSFGPILVEDYKIAAPPVYEYGEVLGSFSRAALAQMGELHYLVVVTSLDVNPHFMPTIRTFSRVMQSFGCEKAYCLDGGQTGIIVMNDELFSTPNYGNQRMVSDMIYFATAIPDSE